MSSPLLDRLDQTAADIRRTARSAIAQTTAAVLIGSATLLVLIDWLGRFQDPGLRWLFTSVLVIATAVAAWRSRKRFHANDATRLGVAKRLQAIDPRLGSRLASAVEFADSEADDPSAGSAELRRAVVIDASNRADELPYQETVDRAPARRAARLLGAATAAMVAMGLLAPSAIGSGLYRLALPWADAPWPRDVRLEVAEAPERLARGGDFEATAINRLGPIPEDTYFEYRVKDRGGAKSDNKREPAQLVGDRAVATRPQVEHAFEYRFTGGDDNTMPWRQVEVVDAPRVESLTTLITPPVYSGLPERSTTGAIHVLVGSRVELSGSASEPLASATLTIEGGEPMALKLGPGNRFAVEPDGFVAGEAADSQYRVALRGETGVTGEAGPHRYRVVDDTPPRVAWASGADDHAVPAGALVPISAAVTDDLAVRTIDIEWTQQGEGEPKPERLRLSDRGEAPPAKRSLDEVDEQSVTLEWDLEPLGLKAGDVLEVSVVAADYRPAEGRTPSARRVAVVSDDEFLQRLAGKQSRLLARVQQATATQRDATQATADLEAEVRESGEVAQRDLDRLTSTEFQQREAAGAVDDPAAGAARLARELLAELRRARVDAPDLDKQLAGANKALGRLAEKTLPAARGGLASARRSGQRKATDEFVERLAESKELQQEAVNQLESVAERLTGWADYQRFATEAAELQRIQRELAAESRQAAAKAASGGAEADRAKRLLRQAEATRRFEKLKQAMKGLLQRPSEGDQPTRAAEAVGDALAEADDAGVAESLRRAGSDLARSRDGDASRAQQQASEGLERMLDALRRRTPTDPSELIKGLEEERAKLAELQRQTDQLRDAPDTRQSRAARRRAADRAARQSRRLERLTAQRASESVQKGADRAGERGPDPRRQMAEAGEAFEQAKQEINNRIRELQNELTQRLLDQLAKKIGSYLERQESVLEETLGLATEAERGDSIEDGAKPLALDERDLADEVGGFAERLAGRAVFELALREASSSAGEAARRLARTRVGRQTQRLEADALRRLKQVQQVLEQNQQDQENQQQQQQGGGGGGGSQPPPSLIDVAELKMLRLMQVELLDATDAYEADSAEARRRGGPLPRGWGERGQELRNRQRRLTELALELATRDNKSQADDAN